MAGWLERARERSAHLRAEQGAVEVPLPRFVRVLAALTAVAVAVLEFGFNLAERPLLRSVVLALAVALVSGFAAWMAVRTWRNRRQLFPFLFEERVDLLLLGVALIALIFSPRASSVIVIGRMAVAGGAWALTTAVGRRAVHLANLRPPQTVALSFLALVAFGTVLLMLPAATVDGRGASFLDALFTMTSATCVTGLVVHSTGGYFTPFGQVVILIAIQIGGIGMMVLAASFAVLVGGRIPGRQQVGLGTILGVETPEGVKRLVTVITAATLTTEFIGAAVLFGMWAVGVLPLPEGYESVGGALWWSLFHSISAFCNAGFALQDDSLMRWVENPFVCGAFIILITLGGLGFIVLSDVGQHLRRLRRPREFWNRLQVQSRVMFLATVFLDLGAAVAWLFFEYDGALEGLSVGGKINAAFFQAVTLRTAGFNTVPFEGIAAPTLVVCLAWMFIGAGNGSTGGGVKATTAATVVMAVRAMLRGRDEVEIFGRRLPQGVVYRSISIVLIGGISVALFLIFLTATQDIPFEPLLFETFSAFGTVGLSMGGTAQLDAFGKVAVSVLMYLGRVGPLTLALAIAERPAPKTYSYPQGDLAVG